ncbi:MAG: dihydrolipoyl dehydrogenase family protein [Candidatus Acidiferrales bacterium]
MTQTFDLVAIGTGSASATVATRCRAAGWQVAIVDSRPFGGTCALRGCDPKKVLVGAAEVVDWQRRMNGKGVAGERVGLDWAELMRFKRSFTDPVPAARERSYATAGVVAFHGRARFLGPTTIAVGENTLEARHVLIATGARPATLKFPGAEYVITSDQFLELEQLPTRLAFIGGGYVTMEFAHLAARAGTQVSVFHRGARPLELFDPDLVGRLTLHTRALGVRLELEAEVSAVEKDSAGFRVHAGTPSGACACEADLVVHGAGRVPEIDDLNLGAAGVEREPRGVKVNEFLQSVSNSAVYAAGDAAASSGPPLTPVAGYEGEIVADNLLKGNLRTADYRVVPSVVFTLPPLASVGLSEAEARAQGLRFRVNYQDTSGWYSSKRVGETCSAFKVLIEEETDRLLGAHLLGPQAEELINVFALALRARLPGRELKETLFAYPTHGSNIRYML